MMRLSIAIGILGGLADLVSGFVLLADSYTGGPSMGMMGPSSGVWGGIFLMALGISVLVTTTLMAGVWGARSPAMFRALMVLYGVAMLGIGVAMLARLFSMTSGFVLSGGAMIVLGAAMLFSAAMMKPAMGRSTSPTR